MSDMMSAEALLNRYRNTLDRKERRELLLQLVAVQGQTPENELRERLLDARYQTQNGADVDRFLFGWVSIGMSTHRIGKAARRKDAEEILAIWQTPLVAEYGEAGRQVQEDELYNLMLLYIDLCRKDRNYNSVLWGIGTIKEDTRTGKIAKEIAQNAYGFPQSAGMTEEFSVFAQAAREAFVASYPREEELFDAQVARQTK